MEAIIKSTGEKCFVSNICSGIATLVMIDRAKVRSISGEMTHPVGKASIERIDF